MVLGVRSPNSDPLKALGEDPALPLPASGVSWHSLACDGIIPTPSPIFSEMAHLGVWAGQREGAGGAHWELVVLEPLGHLPAGR